MRAGRKKSKRVVLLITGSVMLSACQRESPPPPPTAWENLGDPNATNYAGTNQFGTNPPSGPTQRPHYSHSSYYPWIGSHGRIGTGSSGSSSGSKSSNPSSTSRNGFGSHGHSSSGS